MDHLVLERVLQFAWAMLLVVLPAAVITQLAEFIGVPPHPVLLVSFEIAFVDAS